MDCCHRKVAVLPKSGCKAHCFHTSALCRPTGWQQCVQHQNTSCTAELPSVPVGVAPPVDVPAMVQAAYSRAQAAPSCTAVPSQCNQTALLTGPAVVQQAGLLCLLTAVMCTPLTGSAPGYRASPIGTSNWRTCCWTETAGMGRAPSSKSATLAIPR